MEVTRITIRRASVEEDAVIVEAERNGDLVRYCTVRVGQVYVIAPPVETPAPHPYQGWRCEVVELEHSRRGWRALVRLVEDGRRVFWIDPALLASEGVDG